jgi:hypothetical protein
LALYLTAETQRPLRKDIFHLLLRGQQMKIFSHFLAEDFSGAFFEESIF